MKVLFLLSFLAFSNFCNSQTQKETEDWIISKIMKYKEPYSSSTSDLPSELQIKVDEQSIKETLTSVSFKNCKLMIVLRLEGKTYHDFKVDYWTKDFKYVIPISKIVKIDYSSSPYSLMISTANANIFCSKEDVINSSNNETSYEKDVILHVNLDAENDLENRLRNAFKYLKENYCHVPEPKEIF